MLNKIDVNILTKVADLIGKKTLVMWCILTTFTTGYLFLENNKLHSQRLDQMEQSYERLVDEIKGIKHLQNKNAIKIDSTSSKIDTTIENVKQTLKRLER